MQEGEARREQLLQMLRDSTAPISGSALARSLGVSRQVIVQDIALLRAVNKDILATTKGYVLYSQQTEACHRIYCVNHSDDAIADELNTIVDNGGKVLSSLNMRFTGKSQPISFWRTVGMWQNSVTV